MGKRWRNQIRPVEAASHAAKKARATSLTNTKSRLEEVERWLAPNLGYDPEK